MPLTPLTDAREIESAVDALRQRFAHGAEEVEAHVGWPGGGGSYRAYYRRSENVWGKCTFDGHKWSITFGIGNPAQFSGAPITVKATVPTEGINRRFQGVLARDRGDDTYLVHAGNVGAGANRIAAHDFFQQYRGGRRDTVRWPDGQTTEVLVVTDVADEQAAAQLVYFVREVDRIKSGG